MLVPVSRVDQVEVLRTLRNECREWMTGDQRDISITEQAVWWSTIDKRFWEVHLFIKEREFAGFGLLRFQDQKWWMTYGLGKKFRGKGWGVELVTELCQGHKEIWAEALVGNVASCITMERCGFQYQSMVVGGIHGTVCKFRRIE